MRSALVVAFALVAAGLVALPTAAAGPIGCGCDPIILLLVVQVVVSCAAQDARYLTEGTPACFGITPALVCSAEEIKREAGLSDGCAEA